MDPLAFKSQVWVELLSTYKKPLMSEYLKMTSAEQYPTTRLVVKSLVPPAGFSPATASFRGELLYN